MQNNPQPKVEEKEKKRRNNKNQASTYNQIKIVCIVFELSLMYQNKWLRTNVCKDHDALS